MFGRKPSKRVGIVLVAALAAVLAVETVALAATLIRSGKAVSAVYTVTNPDGAGTANGSPTVIPDMLLNVNVPQGEQALLIITFSMENSCQGPSGYSCYVRARLNSQGTSPGAVRFSSTA